MKNEINLYSELLKDKILELKHNHTIRGYNMILIPESDYGFAEIYRIHDDILVFLIPTYGGTPTFYKSYTRNSIDLLITELKSIS